MSSFVSTSGMYMCSERFYLMLVIFLNPIFNSRGIWTDAYGRCLLLCFFVLLMVVLSKGFNFRFGCCFMFLIAFRYKMEPFIGL